MKNQIIAVYVILIIAGISCSNETTMPFKITNESTDQISNIKISATGSTNIETVQLENNKQLYYQLNMTDFPQTDGSYGMEFERNGKIEKENFGYYTNGYPLNKRFNIVISNNETSIKQE